MSSFAQAGKPAPNCFRYSVDVFFPGKSKDRIEFAKTICNGEHPDHDECFYFEECRLEAARTGTCYGVWGAVNFQVPGKELMEELDSYEFKLWEVGKAEQKAEAQSHSIKNVLAHKKLGGTDE